MSALEIGDSSNDELQGLKSNKISKRSLQMNVVINCLFNLVSIRGFALIMFFTTLILVAFFIYLNDLGQDKIKQCHSLQKFNNQSIQFSQCEKCHKCEQFENQEYCMECDDSTFLHAAECVKLCPQKFKAFKNECILQEYDEILIQIDSFKSKQLKNHQINYLLHGYQDSQTLILILKHAVSSNKTISEVIEIQVSKGLSQDFDLECGRNSYTQFVLDDLLPTLVEKLNLTAIEMVILVGLEDTSDEAFQLQTHLHQIAHFKKESFWVKKMAPSFKPYAIGINPKFRINEFLAQQPNITYHWSDNLVINLQGNNTFNAEESQIEEISEELIVTYINSLIRGNDVNQ